jgi:prevent-host-death family protein
MIRRVNHVSAFEAKNRLGRLLDRVQAGEELLITRHGEPVAMLVPVGRNRKKQVETALAKMKEIRDEIEAKTGKISYREIRQWINQGRR